MPIKLYQLDHTLVFPHPSHALSDPNGLLAYGGDLAIERLILAYRNGIFPWYCEGEPIMWWSPTPRTVLQLEQFHLSASMSKFIRKTSFHVTLNQNFAEVIQQCALVHGKQSGTWITKEMTNAYINLHQAKYAQSIEVWDDDVLVGGLYGVVIGKCFCGESMFHRKSNASKLAIAVLVKHMLTHGDHFIDCQMPTKHLASLGAKTVARDDYLQLLTKASAQPTLPAHQWQPQTLFQHNQHIQPPR